MKIKHILSVSILMAAILSVCRVHADEISYGDSLFSDPSLSYSQNKTLDARNIDTLSFQGVIASATVAAPTFDDGLPSTATISFATQPAVSGYLVKSIASTTLTIPNGHNAGLANIYLYFCDGTTTTTIKEGGGGAWNYTTGFATASAASLATYLDGLSAFAAAASSNAVTVYTVSSGTFANSYTFLVSSPAALTTATWSGGRDNLKITVHTKTFEAGVDFTPVATASGTAKALSAAIVAWAPFSGVLSSTWNMVATSSVGVVYATATAIGSAANSWVLGSSVQSYASTGAWANGGASQIDLTTDRITGDLSRAFSDGFPMWLQATAGTVPTGLTAGVTYYAICHTTTTTPFGPAEFQLSDTSTGAIAATPVIVNMTAVTGSGSFKLNPTAFAGTPTFKWQVSNDNSNWTDLSVSSITFATPWTATSVLWTGDTVAKYYRGVFTGPTGGGVNLKIIGFGKKHL